MNRKSIFFTSDWHVGHKNALRFDDRPFSDLEDMHKSLIKRYNSTVPESGICYFLGDMGNNVGPLKEVIKKLNGTKVLVLGNHDKGVNTMYNCGFDVVVSSCSMTIAGKRTTLSHCPLLGTYREDTSGMKGVNKDSTENWHGESRKRNIDCSLKNEGQFHLHGHIHSRKGKHVSKKILGRQYDVGVTANGYAPVSISTIESWITRSTKELEE